MYFMVMFDLVLFWFSNIVLCLMILESTIFILILIISEMLSNSVPYFVL